MKFWFKLSEDGDNAKHEGAKELEECIACTVQLYVCWCYQTFNAV